MPRCFAFRGDGLHCGVDSAATLMTEHDNQAGSQNVDAVLDASQAFVIDHVARYSNDEQISEAFIKDDFGWHTRIRTTEDDRKRVLTFRQLRASFRGLLGSHTQRKRARIFIAVRRHVFSFVDRVVWMLQITSGKSAIAFLQSRDRVSGSHNWLVWICWISGSAKLMPTN